MCRRNEAFGTALMAFGAGLLVSVVFTSGIWTAIVGMFVLVLGFFVAKKR